MLMKSAWFVDATWSRGDDKPPEWRFMGERVEDAARLPEPALRLIVEREQVQH